MCPQPVSGELIFNARPSGEPVYEYACHEGNTHEDNYVLPSILAGARQLEAQQTPGEDSP